MEKVNEQETGKKVYDFTTVSVEIEFDTFKEIDASKTIGNIIHKGTDDLGIDEIARTIYKEGKVEMDARQAKIVWAILMNSNLLAGFKKAVNNLFTI